MGNMGNVMYVIVAFIGGIFIFGNIYNLSLIGYSTLTVGIVVVYLTFVKTLSQTVGRVSSQIGMISMGLAGASRIFEFLDEEPEFDEGYVTLVKVNKSKDGMLEETDEDTNHWAWKHPHKATDTTDLIELKGEVVLEDVDFSYVEGKEVLYDISLYATPGQKIALVGATGAFELE